MQINIKRIAALLTVSALLSCLASCKGDTGESDTESSLPPSDSPTVLYLPSPLPESEDMGEEYIDSFVFLGESTTYHLKSRGVLKDGADTKQVWGPKSGTLMLDATTASCRIVYPESGEELDIYEATRRKRPEFILLTFGLNGATRSISRGESYFSACYEKLIDTLLKASPDTTVILQSCFPVGKEMDVSGFSVDTATLNRYIEEINGWTERLAERRSLGYLNTAEILRNADGYLKVEYEADDHYHLNADAYRAILGYIRTHGYPSEV